MSKKKKEVLANIGNFEVYIDKGTDHDYLRIKSAIGHWCITHRDDSPMFGLWVGILREPDGAKALEVRLVMEYTLTNMLLDKEFIEDYFEIVKKKNDRDTANAPIPTEEEDAEAIKELEILDTIDKELNNSQE